MQERLGSDRATLSQRSAFSALPFNKRLIVNPLPLHQPILPQIQSLPPVTNDRFSTFRLSTFAQTSTTRYARTSTTLWLCSSRSSSFPTHGGVSHISRHWRWCALSGMAPSLPLHIVQRSTHHWASATPSNQSSLQVSSSIEWPPLDQLSTYAQRSTTEYTTLWRALRFDLVRHRSYMSGIMDFSSSLDAGVDSHCYQIEVIASSACPLKPISTFWGPKGRNGLDVRSWVYPTWAPRCF